MPSKTEAAGLLLAVVHLALCLMDAGLTVAALDKGLGAEANPLIAAVYARTGGLGVFLAEILAGAVVLAVALDSVTRGRLDAQVFLGLVFVVALRAVTVVNNIVVITQ